MKYFYGRYLEAVSDKTDPSTRIIYILVISPAVSNRVNDISYLIDRLKKRNL